MEKTSKRNLRILPCCKLENVSDITSRKVRLLFVVLRGVDNVVCGKVKHYIAIIGLCVLFLVTNASALSDIFVVDK